MNLTLFSALIALAFSLISLFFTFRKDAHRIRLEVTPLWKQWIEVIGVNNDSSFPVGVLTVGYFEEDGLVVWFPGASDYSKNCPISLPVRVEARSLFALQIICSNHLVSPNSPHGYCIQLESGRIYVIQHTATIRMTWRLYLTSLISRITAGSYAPWLSRPRLPNN
jgi:hypothetical protein